ncbi:MAG: hypothetical protein ACN6OJ_15035 [Chryseobacterium sp.]|uniref:hypothetical protein n=1 Tax=Chryseobacterium sp. TaxID=1871047 RepID=UPI003D0C0862
MGCNKILFSQNPYCEKDIRKEMYDLLFDHEYPSWVLKHVEKIEYDGFLVESLSFNGPKFIFIEYGNNAGEISYVPEKIWKSQVLINFIHRDLRNLKYPLVLNFEKK